MPRKLVVSTLGAAVVGGVLFSSLPASAAVPTGWTEAAHDTFTRTATGTWGTAETGGAWSTTISKGATMATTGSAATTVLPQNTTFTADLKATPVTDTDFSDAITLTAPAGTTYDMQHRWLVRQQADGSAYTGRIRIKSTGAASLALYRLNGTTSTTLPGLTLPFTVAPGQTVRGELQVTGTAPVQVQARAWIDGTATPAWQVAYSDTSASAITAAGYTGVTDYTFTASSPITVSHDDVSVGNGAGAAPVLPQEEVIPTAPTPVKPNLATRGSAPIGSASYPVPAGALFVDAAKGLDTNPGTEAAPFKTVAAAAAKAVSGSTLVLRAGIYHQSVAVASNKTMAIQNYPGEAVWFDGSVPVTNWVKSGTTWVSSNWLAEHSATMGGDSTFKSRFIGTNTMAADPDMVFVNGSQLKQVASASLVVPGTFAVNDSANTITIGTDPTGQEVRASDLEQAISLSGPNSSLKGIGVRRYATPYEVKGAVRIANTGGTIENVTIEDVATIGISSSSFSKTFNHLTVKRAGLVGITGTQADNSTLTNSIIDNNNTEAFNDEPVAGGIKFGATRTMTVDNISASNNHGSGIWFDVSSYKITIVNSTAVNNTKHGIEVEISDTGIIANNVASGGEDGIIVFDSGNFKVFNNEIAGGRLYGLILKQDERRQADLTLNPEGHDPRYKTIVDPTVPWITQNIQVSNNVIGKGGYFQFYALDVKTNRAVDTWNVTIDGNLFNPRPLKTDATMVGWGKGDNVTLERYETGAALATAKNSAWKNAQTTTVQSITDMADDKLTYGATALPLPADVAAATGIAAGAQQLGAQQ